MVAAPDELWGLADEHDFVVIAAPNDAHVPLARRGLDAGLRREVLSVLCGKREFAELPAKRPVLQRGRTLARLPAVVETAGIEPASAVA